MQEKYQENFEYRGHEFTIGLLVGSHHYGIIINDANLITIDQQGRLFDGTLEDTIKHAEQLVDAIIVQSTESPHEETY